jgi:hypothetical protein
MLGTGLRRLRHLPKQVRRRPKGESFLPRWLIILLVVAVIATIAGFVTFGGADMGGVNIGTGH